MPFRHHRRLFAAGPDAVALLPSTQERVGELQTLEDVAIAGAVARQALTDGVAEASDAATLDGRIDACMWEPHYRPYLEPR